MKGTTKSFRIGRVRADRRGKIWYLAYHEDGQRHRPRVGPSRDEARRLAAQINSQLELGAPAALSFEPIDIVTLRDRWLEHHEHVLRSSVQTVRRYQAATRHLLNFIDSVRVPSKTSLFQTHHAESFVRYLRSVQVAPNGHANSRKRPLLDKGIVYILQTCRSMFHYAVKRRHLSPYAENPFDGLSLDRIPIESSRPIVLLSQQQEQQFLEACDDWQFSIFLTLMLTGLRPGELTHLLLPDDLDLDEGLLHVRNKPALVWQVKTRSERMIPLIGPLVEVLRRTIGSRQAGPVFLRERFQRDPAPVLSEMASADLVRELQRRVSAESRGEEPPLSRQRMLSIARTVWRDAGAIKTEHVRTHFMRITRAIEIPECTAPKTLRHQFATCLQDANVDPLIRCELMGHSVGNSSAVRGGLGMTARYTHSRPETIRQQLFVALEACSAVSMARER